MPLRVWAVLAFQDRALGHPLPRRVAGRLGAVGQGSGVGRVMPSRAWGQGQVRVVGRLVTAVRRTSRSFFVLSAKTRKTSSWVTP
jgi:hypothetical protein